MNMRPDSNGTRASASILTVLHEFHLMKGPDTEAIFPVGCSSYILEQHNIIKRLWHLFQSLFFGTEISRLTKILPLLQWCHPSLKLTRRYRTGHVDSASTLTRFCGAVTARVSRWRASLTRVKVLSVRPSPPQSVTLVSVGNARHSGSSTIGLWTASRSRKVGPTN